MVNRGVKSHALKSRGEKTQKKEKKKAKPLQLKGVQQHLSAAKDLHHISDGMNALHSRDKNCGRCLLFQVTGKKGGKKQDLS